LESWLSIRAILIRSFSSSEDFSELKEEREEGLRTLRMGPFELSAKMGKLKGKSKNNPRTLNIVPKITAVQRA
jgi:hypothetical protein